MRQRGFTLIELMVVLVIVAAVAGLVAPSFHHSVEKMRARSEMKAVATLLDKAKTLAFCRKSTLTVQVEGAVLTVEDEEKTLSTRKTFEWLRFDPAVVVINRNGFPNTHEIRCTVQEDAETIRF